MKVDFLIDGASVGAASGATFVRKDPFTGGVRYTTHIALQLGCD